MKDGKLVDVIIEDIMGRNPDTGIPYFAGFSVWADKGLLDVILNIPGVADARAYGTQYYIDLDPRYDREWVRAEIEAQIKINSGTGE